MAVEASPDDCAALWQIELLQHKPQSVAHQLLFLRPPHPLLQPETRGARRDTRKLSTRAQQMDYNARERSEGAWPVRRKADPADESGTFVGARKEARARVDNSVRDQIERVCREVLAPIVKADGGEMYLVRWDGDDVHVHLAGACAGCPGSSTDRRQHPLAGRALARAEGARRRDDRLSRPRGRQASLVHGRGERGSRRARPGRTSSQAGGPPWRDSASALDGRAGVAGLVDLAAFGSLMPPLVTAAIDGSIANGSSALCDRSDARFASVRLSSSTMPTSARPTGRRRAGATSRPASPSSSARGLPTGSAARVRPGAPSSALSFAMASW